jgi:hypothetical protein
MKATDLEKKDDVRLLFACPSQFPFRRRVEAIHPLTATNSMENVMADSILFRAK